MSGTNRPENGAAPPEAAEREADEFAGQTGYRPSANQNRHEPMPASRHDDGPQGAGVQNSEPSNSGQVRAAPSRRVQRRDRG